MVDQAKAAAEALARSNDMEPVQGSVDVAIPTGVLWELFTQANQWPRWNACFYWAANRDLAAGANLVWCFQPIRWWYLYKFPAIARIVEVEPADHVTWHVTAVPGFFARHTYSVEDLGAGRTRFSSWEQAMGPEFRLTRGFWIAHFVFVRDRSLEGAKLLEAIYRERGRLTPNDLPRRPVW
jgi:hypothetical protein